MRMPPSVEEWLREEGCEHSFVIHDDEDRDPKLICEKCGKEVVID